MTQWQRWAVDLALGLLGMLVCLGAVRLYQDDQTLSQIVNLIVQQQQQQAPPSGGPPSGPHPAPSPNK